MPEPAYHKRCHKRHPGLYRRVIPRSWNHRPKVCWLSKQRNHFALCDLRLCSKHPGNIRDYCTLASHSRQSGCGVVPSSTQLRYHQEFLSGYVHSCLGWHHRGLHLRFCDPHDGIHPSGILPQIPPLCGSGSWSTLHPDLLPLYPLDSHHPPLYLHVHCHHQE